MKLGINLTLFSLLAFNQAIGQNFTLQETTLNRKNATAFFNTVKKCEDVLRKKAEINSLPFSSKSRLTSNSFTPLSEKFLRNLPPAKDENYGKTVDRDFKNGSDKIIKITYGILEPTKIETQSYVQVIVVFDPDSPSPKIVDLQVKNKADIGILSLSQQEATNLRAKPKPAPVPVAKKKTPTKTQPSKTKKK